MSAKKNKYNFFKVTKARLLLVIIFFVLIMYFAGNPLELLGEEISISGLFSLIILVLLELLLSYIITCIIVFLFYMHRRK